MNSECLYQQVFYLAKVWVSRSKHTYGFIPARSGTSLVTRAASSQSALVAVLPNPSLNTRPPTAWRLGRAAAFVHHRPHGPGAMPPGCVSSNVRRHKNFHPVLESLICDRKNLHPLACGWINT